MPKTKQTFVVVCGIVFRRNRVLITRRPEGAYYGGFWEFPGGKVEAGESPEDGLRRELLEELGIGIAKMELWRKLNYEYSDRKVNLTFFFCELLKCIPRTIDCSTLKWVRYNDLAGYAFPPADLSIIQELRNIPSEHINIRM